MATMPIVVRVFRERVNSLYGTTNPHSTMLTQKSGLDQYSVLRDENLQKESEEKLSFGIEK